MLNFPIYQISIYQISIYQISIYQSVITLQVNLYATTFAKTYANYIYTIKFIITGFISQILAYFVVYWAQQVLIYVKCYRKHLPVSSPLPIFRRRVSAWLIPSSSLLEISLQYLTCIKVSSSFKNVTLCDVLVRKQNFLTSRGYITKSFPGI